MALCKKCGASLREGAAFCDRCGQKVITPPSVPPSAAPARQGGTNAGGTEEHALPFLISIVLSIAVMVLLIGLGGKTYLGKVVDESEKDTFPKPSSEMRDMEIELMAATFRYDADDAMDVQLEYVKEHAPEEYKTITATMIQEEKKALEKKFDYIKEHGTYYTSSFTMTMLRIASHYKKIIKISGIVAGIALALWLLTGGLKKISETFWPLGWLLIAIGGAGYLTFLWFAPTDISRLLDAIPK